MRAFCMAASCCTWRMTCVFGSPGKDPMPPNESIFSNVCVGIGEVLREFAISYVVRSSQEKLSTSRAALSLAPSRNQRPLHTCGGDRVAFPPDIQLSTSALARSPARRVPSSHSFFPTEASYSLSITEARSSSILSARQCSAGSLGIAAEDVARPCCSPGHGRVCACWRGVGRVPGRGLGD
jgi:hypothetical protein